VDREVLEQRRLEAGRLFRQGVWPAEVARQRGVSRQTATVWQHAWQESGTSGLRRAETTGRPARLTAVERRRVEKAMLKGARTHGFSTDLWTLQRVANVIAKVTGVEYHPGHVWKLLRRFGWSWQKPARQAVERDEEELQRWVREEWPRIKNPHARSGLGSSSRIRAAPR
jgi:transposase